jgi:hypothetical protein
MERMYDVEREIALFAKRYNEHGKQHRQTAEQIAEGNQVQNGAKGKARKAPQLLGQPKTDRK